MTSDDDRPRSRLRLWHLTLLPVLVAFAYVNLRDQRVEGPLLVGLAIAGFVAYGAIAWALWSRGVPRLERSPILQRLAPRLGLGAGTCATVAYLAVMGALFLAASIVYVVLEIQIKS